MNFYAPRNFKNGNYYFNKYSALDLIILGSCGFFGTILCFVAIATIMIMDTVIYAIILTVIGGFIVLTGYLLTYQMPIHHNLLGKLGNIVLYHKRQKNI